MQSTDEMRPKVGIGVMVLRGNEVLLGKRKSSHGDGQYAYPGGHLEYMESFEDCARREVKEECGLEIDNIRFLRIANVTEYNPKHYVDIALVADYVSGDPQVLEPEKCESWDWYNLDNLPTPLFSFCITAFEALKSGEVYYDL